MKWFPDFTPIRSAGPMGQVGQADLKDLTDFFVSRPLYPPLEGPLESAEDAELLMWQ